MRKVIAIEYLTLNDVMETPTWTQDYFSEEVGAFQDKHIHAADLILLGHLTYDGMSQAWPNAEPDEGGFAERINALPKEVVTSRTGKLEWNAQPLAPEKLLERVRELKTQEGQNILIYGSGQVVRPLLAAGLLDELHLLVCPVSLKEGKKLFENEPLTLQPMQAKIFSRGMTLLSFTAAGS